MLIADNTVVTFHYRLRTADTAADEPLENSHDGGPMVYLHGHRSIIPGLEQALTGKQAGEHVAVTVAPAQAYGERREDAQQRVPLKYILSKGKLNPGQVVLLGTTHGPREVTLLKVGKFNADIDTNHPLAGKTLLFEIDIVGVRAATAEELAHGHGHGPGGHHH